MTTMISPALRELRFLFSQSGPASAGTRYSLCSHPFCSSTLIIISFRQFVLAHYSSIKQHNPDLPVLIREAKGTPARAFARFGALQPRFPPFRISYSSIPERGIERHVELEGLDSVDVKTKIMQLLALS